MLQTREVAEADIRAKLEEMAEEMAEIKRVLGTVDDKRDLNLQKEPQQMGSRSEIDFGRVIDQKPQVVVTITHSEYYVLSTFYYLRDLLFG